MRIPRGLIVTIMSNTPRLKVTSPMNGWRMSMATCSPQVFPAQKIKVIRPKLMIHKISIPPTSHRTLRRNGPRTTAANAEAIRRNPTTLLTPEQAETTLRGNERPLWTISNSVLPGSGTTLATWTTLRISSIAARVAVVKVSSTRSSTDEYG